MQPSRLSAMLTKTVLMIPVSEVWGAATALLQRLHVRHELVHGYLGSLEPTRLLVLLAVGLVPVQRGEGVAGSRALGLQRDHGGDRNVVEGGGTIAGKQPG